MILQVPGEKTFYTISGDIVFNSNVAPKVRKTERGDKTWECSSCGLENKPWWKLCAFCSKRKD